MNNLTGNIYGHLTVSAPSSKRSPNNELVWKCHCSCGRTAYIRSSKLSQGRRKSCGECTPEERKVLTTDQKSKAKRKVGKIHFSSLSLKKQLFIINDYIMGTDIPTLSDRHKITPNTLRDGINSYREKMNTTHELHYMVQTSKTKLPATTVENALKTQFIEEELRDMLSGDTEEILTDHEIMYCYLFVNAGSNDLALQESQLDKCLPKSTPIRRQYLGMYLRNKPNIKAYIQALQESRLEEIDADTRYVKKELITQVEQLREILATGSSTSRDRGQMLKAIELLGKTIPGTFEDKILVEEVNATTALDKLLDMAKTGTVKQLPAGSITEETYEITEE